MTVLMTANRNESLGGTQCRVEWQGLAAGDVVSAHLRTGQGSTLIFPDVEIPGLRQQPWVAHGWLLDIAALPGGWQRLDLVVKSPGAHALSLGLEVRPSAPDSAVDALQHPGLTTVPGAPMIAVRITPGVSGPDAVALEAHFVDDDAHPSASGMGIDVPDALREAAVLARHENLVRSGEPVTALVDLSASMRPRLAAGTVAGVLAALQAVAAAAHRQEVSVIAVSDRVHDPRPLRLTDDPEEFLRTWTHEIGLRTGAPGGGANWPGDREGGLVVTVSDQQHAHRPVAGRNCLVLLVPAGDGPARPTGPGTVVVSDGRPDAAAVIRGLAHASPTV